MREEIRALQARLDAVDARRGAEDTEALEAKLDSLDRKIDANRADAASVAAQVQARLDKADKSVERLETVIASKSSAPSTAKAEARREPKPAPKAASNPAAAATGGANAKTGAAIRTADAAKPIAEYSLREVQDGIALVQGHGGLYEVGPGDRLPGVGAVLSVERIGRNWVVVTERGRIGGQVDSPQPRYSQQRDPGGYYYDQRF